MVKRQKAGLRSGGIKRTKHGKELEEQLLDDSEAAAGKLTAKRKPPTRRMEQENEDGGVDEKQEKKVMELARAQQEEERQRDEEEEEDELAERSARVRFEESDDESEAESEDDVGEGEDVTEVDASSGFGNSAEVLSAAQSRLVDSFLTGAPGQKRTLADMIMDKIAEKEAGRDMEEDEDEEDALPPKVIEAYSGMAKILKNYRSGKLPKAFKVIPSLERWEEVLWLTRPDEWSPHCLEQATKVFASNLDPKRARQFYEEVLLERCREDIRSNKKLNYHLYQALHRALFKPQPWFKGILLPLVNSGDASLREALILSSVLAKASVPAAHASVVLLKLAQTPPPEWSGCVSIFTIVILNKKYSLPLRVLDALVTHFARFVDDERTLPVLWHQSLLVFLQRYHGDLNIDQRDSLNRLLKAHSHAGITPDIRRELQAVNKKR